MDLIIVDDWLRPVDDAEMVLKVWQAERGIIQELFINEERAQSVFSKRPYKLRQRCDGTTDNCVFALMDDFCTRRILSAIGIYNSAYTEEPGISQDCMDEWVKRGKKQGVHYPEEWDRDAFDGLLESLRSINNYSVAGILQQVIPEKSF